MKRTRNSPIPFNLELHNTRTPIARLGSIKDNNDASTLDSA